MNTSEAVTINRPEFASPVLEPLGHQVFWEKLFEVWVEKVVEEVQHRVHLETKVNTQCCESPAGHRGCSPQLQDQLWPRNYHLQKMLHFPAPPASLHEQQGPPKQQ